MKIFTKKEKLSTGITCLQSSEKHLFVGNVDDTLNILDKNYNSTIKLKINFGTIDIKCKNNSRLKRTGS